ncbi:MAG: RluA family pseudouridine synthase, partial [Phenylobacterium sp.]
LANALEDEPEGVAGVTFAPEELATGAQRADGNGVDSEAEAAKLAGAFAKRRAQKTYWALVAGFPKPGEGVLDLPLAKVGAGDREMVQPMDPLDPRAEPAQTEFVTLSRAGDRVAWMALYPHTGRTHQLRAHMLAMGHPILGDPKYKSEASAELSGDLKLQLHARRLVLAHPSRGQLILEAPMSPEMREGFRRFGFDEHEADPEPFRPAAPKSPGKKKVRR